MMRPLLVVGVRPRAEDVAGKTPLSASGKCLHVSTAARIDI
jgi:hypothetical protein